MGVPSLTRYHNEQHSRSLFNLGEVFQICALASTAGSVIRLRVYDFKSREGKKGGDKNLCTEGEKNTENEILSFLDHD